MAVTSDLAQRLQNEFSTWNKKMDEFRSESVETFRGRESRLQDLAKLMEELREIWRPKMETLAKQFGDKMKVTPKVEPSYREAKFSVQSELAQIELKFWVTTDADVRNLMLHYQLDILPSLMDFEATSQITFPLNDIDRNALGKWIDDRVVSFAQTYFSLYRNEYYLKDHMVEDPIAKLRFPKFAAAAKVEADGKTLYFISSETHAEFEKKRKQ